MTDTFILNKSDEGAINVSVTFINRNHGQSILEYVFIAMLVILGVIVMGPYVIRSVNAHFKLWDEAMDQRQVPINVGISGECHCGKPVAQACGGKGWVVSCAPNQRLYASQCSPPTCGFGSSPQSSIGTGTGTSTGTRSGVISTSAGYIEYCSDTATDHTFCCSQYTSCSAILGSSNSQSCCGTAGERPAGASPDANGFLSANPSPGRDLLSHCYTGEELGYNQCDPIPPSGVDAYKCKPSPQLCNPACLPVGYLPNNASFCPGAQQGLTHNWWTALLGPQNCTQYTYQGNQVQTWTPPPTGNGYFTVEIWGGGGGGGGGGSGSGSPDGGGGGGGGLAVATLAPGQNGPFYIHVGKGGQGGTGGGGSSGTGGSDGASSWFSINSSGQNSTTYLEAYGGHGGGRVVSGGTGAQGGTANITSGLLSSSIYNGGKGGDAAIGGGGGGGAGGGGAGGQGSCGASWTGSTASGVCSGQGVNGQGSSFYKGGQGGHSWGDCAFGTTVCGQAGTSATGPGGGGGGSGAGWHGEDGQNGMVTICTLNTCPDAADPNAPKCVAQCNQGYVPQTDPATQQITCQPIACPSLINGSFEQPTVASGNWASESNPQGWSTPNGPLTIHNNQGEAGSSDLAAVGSQHAEMDDFGTSTGNKTISQTVSTVPGKTYYISFAYSPRSGKNTTDCKGTLSSKACMGVDVQWNGATIATVAADGTNQSTNQWTYYSYPVTGTGSDTLSFVADQSAANGCDTGHCGGYIDDISINCCPVAQLNCSTPTGNGVIVRTGSTSDNDCGGTGVCCNSGEILAGYCLGTDSKPRGGVTYRDSRCVRAYEGDNDCDDDHVSYILFCIPCPCQQCSTPIANSGTGGFSSNVYYGPPDTSSLTCADGSKPQCN